MSIGMMNNDQTQQLAYLARDVARQAGQVALGGYRTRVRIDRKQGAELVTQFDFAAEAAIREGLEKAEPGIPILAEEGGGPERCACYWCVDPIDGTTNFAHGHPFWAVSIALVQDGEPVVGAVVAPVLLLEWVAAKGHPTLRNGDACYVSETGSVRDALVATGFPYDRQTNPDNNFQQFAFMQKQAVGVRRCGSAALDLCLVADGTYDGYWEKSRSSWDIAAGIRIVRSAGGVATSMGGEEVDLFEGNVVATNGWIHEELVGLLRKSRES